MWLLSLQVWGNRTWAPDDNDDLRSRGRTLGAMFTVRDVIDPAAASGSRSGSTGVGSGSNKLQQPGSKSKHSGLGFSTTEGADANAAAPHSEEGCNSANMRSSDRTREAESGPSAPSARLTVSEAIRAATAEAGALAARNYADWGASDVFATETHASSSGDGAAENGLEVKLRAGL